ncbi:hypothetical protein FF38_10476 [Lucilia cuprina]|uniref:Uncharacterized protein n=1 Tax=Lucilia cuprina TaxID=7375 RepID=A0A0L0CMC6_LUCCU|nr:hypothetical protein FF38_10476 [Lucilia cuprina]
MFPLAGNLLDLRKPLQGLKTLVRFPRFFEKGRAKSLSAEERGKISAYKDQNLSNRQIAKKIVVQRKVLAQNQS